VSFLTVPIKTASKNPKIKTSIFLAAINIRSVTVNAPSVCAWFLDDSQGVAFPLIRLIFTSLFFTAIF
jgi:hypothetical protein